MRAEAAPSVKGHWTMAAATLGGRAVWRSRVRVQKRFRTVRFGCGLFPGGRARSLPLRPSPQAAPMSRLTRLALAVAKIAVVEHQARVAGRADPVVSRCELDIFTLCHKAVPWCLPEGKSAPVGASEIMD